MKSVDTNILLYGTNADCDEHTWARPVLEQMLSEPGAWILADQVLFEYYRLLRHPRVLARPLSGRDAAEQLRYFRDLAGCYHCGYEISLWPEVIALLDDDNFAPARTFDAVLAVTLRAARVERLYTRNAKDFESLGWFEVTNPEP